MNPETQILQRAYKRWLDSPTKHALARDDRGHLVMPEDPAAVCWCASGSLRKEMIAAGMPVDSCESLTSPFLDRLEPDIVPLNDSGNHTAVAWAFVSAIVASSRRGL